MLLTAAISLALLIFLYVVVIDYLKARRSRRITSDALDRMIEGEQHAK